MTPITPPPAHLRRLAEDLQIFTGFQCTVVERVNAAADLRVFGGDSPAGADDRKSETLELYAVGEMRFGTDTEAGSCGFISGQFVQPCELLFMGDINRFGLDRIVSSVVGSLVGAKVVGDIFVQTNGVEIWNWLIRGRPNAPTNPRFHDTFGLILFRFNVTSTLSLTPCKLC